MAPLLCLLTIIRTVRASVRYEAKEVWDAVSFDVKKVLGSA